MRNLAPIFLLLLAAFVRLAAAPADLGAGLGYLRVQALDHDRPEVEAALAADRALVLDFRYATANGLAAADIYPVFARRRSTSPLFVLVSPATAPALAEALVAAPVKLLTLGVASSVPTPQVIVAQTAEADRRAYDALAAGTPLEALVSGKVVKERYDEAALMSDFRNGNTEAQQPAAPVPSKDKAADAPASKAPPPTDRVLQRALDLHRALLAVQPRS